MDDKTGNERPRITPRAKGPLLVKGLPHLRNSKGERLAFEGNIALCRCGGSAKKPFCDGTHRNNGFDDANTAEHGADRVERFQAPDVTILDNRFLCAHIGACTDGLAAVFRYGQEPWIDPAGADVERIREAIERCPSGALGYALSGEALGGKEERDFQRDPVVTVAKNGPYTVVGAVELETEAWGEGASREHYALCRCGASKNKPFCDGSHWQVEFADDDN